MIIVTILSWIVCGLLVGLAARFLIPGRQSLNLPMTTLLGIGGALVGGFLYSFLRAGAVEPFSLSAHNWYGWTVSILGAMLVLGTYTYFSQGTWDGTTKTPIK
jgi:uncharacterized membrane protein YeaQ/YmgE (transglycosylase-associated protein family)